MIILDRLGKGFRTKSGEIKWVFKGLSVTFEDGVNTMIIAPRGQGKTLLVDLICGTERVSKGDILRSGRISPPYNSRAHLTARLSLAQNLRFMCDIYGKDYESAYDFVVEFGELERHMDKSYNAAPNDAKGRFCSSMLFAMGFDHIIADEALDGGDGKYRKKCIEYLDHSRDIHTLLLATSSPKPYWDLIDRAGLLEGGRIEFYDNKQDTLSAFTEINKVLV